MPRGNPHGQIINKSNSGGRTVAQMWEYLFQKNELAFREKRWEDILTDGQITTVMFFAFPDRLVCAAFRQVRKVRAAYRRGGLKGLPLGKERRSFAYFRCEDGKIICRKLPRYRDLQESE